jgi:protein-tyrosine-phosphatase
MSFITVQKHIGEFLGQTFDYVITVCDRAKQTCQIFRGASHMRHWSFEDAAAASLKHGWKLQQVRDGVAAILPWDISAPWNLNGTRH